MNIFSYDPVTGEYLGEGTAQFSPLDKAYLVPANATLTPPPLATEKQTAVWNGQAWTLTPDYRGTTYWTAPRVITTIKNLGEVPPEGATVTAPPSDYHSWNGTDWVESVDQKNADLALQVRAERDRLIREVYDPAIMKALREYRLATTATSPKEQEAASIEEINARITAWDAYAVALCKLPEQPGFPDTIAWPEPPSDNTQEAV